jgi:hypothetical protein
MKSFAPLWSHCSPGSTWSFSDLPARGKPTETTTPVEQQVSSEATVTVIDPRRPLYGQTFPLNGLVNHSDYGPCVVVWISSGLQRQIPIIATNLAAEPPVVNPCPLSLTSIIKLLSAYARFAQQSKERTNDSNGISATITNITTTSATATESAAHDSGDESINSGAISLADSQSTTTGKPRSAIRHNLLRPAHKQKTKGGAK